MHIQQDYLMRLIHEMVRVILKLFFNIDTESELIEMLEQKEEKESLDNLLDLIDAGEINRAENDLYDIMETRGNAGLMIALSFYSYLNELPEEFLVQNQFSREEIKMGLEHVAVCYGLNGIMTTFLSDI